MADLALGIDPWNTNRYAYGGGNPVGGIDLDGHQYIDDGPPPPACVSYCEAYEARQQEAIANSPDKDDDGIKDDYLANTAAGAVNTVTGQADYSVLGFTGLPDRFSRWFDEQVGADRESADYGNAEAFLLFATLLTGTAGVGLAAGGAQAAKSLPAIAKTSKVPAAAKSESGLARAERARDSAGLKPDGTPNRRSPVYVGGVDEGGNVMGTGNGPRGSNIHAEDIIQEWRPGAQMTEPFAWRRNVDTGELEWIPHTVCVVCQSKYPPSLFPPGTRGAPGGAWGE